VPWRAATEDWTGAKERVAKDPKWDTWLRQERRTVDDWMEKSHDRVAWVCGWCHDFVSKTMR
jgi:hypothetical protein